MEIMEIMEIRERMEQRVLMMFSSLMISVFMEPTDQQRQKPRDKGPVE